MSSYQDSSFDSDDGVPVLDKPVVGTPLIFSGVICILVIGSLLLFARGTTPAVDGNDLFTANLNQGMTDGKSPYVFPVMFRMSFVFQLHDGSRGVGHWIYDFSHGDDKPQIRGDDLWDITSTKEGSPVYDGVGGTNGQMKFWTTMADGSTKCSTVEFAMFNRKQVEINGEYQGMEKKKFPEEAHVWKFSWNGSTGTQMDGTLYINKRGVPIGLHTSTNPEDDGFPTFAEQDMHIFDFQTLQQLPSSMKGQPKYC